MPQTTMKDFCSPAGAVLGAGAGVVITIARDMVNCGLVGQLQLYYLQPWSLASCLAKQCNVSLVSLFVR